MNTILLSLAQVWHTMVGIGIGFFLFVLLLVITAYVSLGFAFRDSETLEAIREHRRKEDFDPLD